MCIVFMNFKVGVIFVVSFCKDVLFLFVVGGLKGNLYVWDILVSGEVFRRFGKFFLRLRRVINYEEV